MTKKFKQLKNLALTLPGFGSSGSFDAPNFEGLKNEFTNPPKGQTVFGALASQGLNVVFLIAVFLAFFFLVWGALAYIYSEGNKENLAKARSKIIYAIVGLIIILLAFSITQYVASIFNSSKYNPGHQIIIPFSNPSQ